MEENVGDLALIGMVDEIGGARPVAAHAHVERAIALEREAAIGPVELLADGYLTINPQTADVDLLRARHGEPRVGDGSPCGAGVIAMGVPQSTVAAAISKYGIDPEKPNPTTV